MKNSFFVGLVGNPVRLPFGQRVFSYGKIDSAVRESMLLVSHIHRVEGSNPGPPGDSPATRTRSQIQTTLTRVSPCRARQIPDCRKPLDIMRLAFVFLIHSTCRKCAEPEAFIEPTPRFESLASNESVLDVPITHRSQVTNDFGIEWMRRHLGDEYNIHVLDFKVRQSIFVYIFVKKNLSREKSHVYLTTREFTRGSKHHPTNQK